MKLHIETRITRQYDAATMGQIMRDIEIAVNALAEQTIVSRYEAQTAIPTTGQFVAGDIVSKLAPSLGGEMGWLCIASGSPGTLVPFAPIGAGAVFPLSTNYISGTGTAGADNTAQNVVTIAIPAKTMRQNGDRIRVRSYWRGDTGSPVTGTIKVNGVTVSATTDGGAATLQVNEAWLHYIDNTHANIIAMAGGTLDTTLSAANVAGFTWNAAQNCIISQNQIANNHIVVFFLAIDVFPKGLV